MHPQDHPIDLRTELIERTEERDRALHQLAAISNVLKAISDPSFELISVLEVIAQSSAELCDADDSTIFLRRQDEDGDAFYGDASWGTTPEFKAFMAANPRRLWHKSLVPKVVAARAVVHIPDKLLDPNYAFPGASQARTGSGISDSRALLGVPMFRNGVIEGVFSLTRKEPKPFSAEHIQLVRTFADQALLAIENTRLFHEVQTRTAELDQSLQQQTAMAEGLKTISRSAFDLRSVFDTLIESATRLCDAASCILFRREGDKLYLDTSFGGQPDFIRWHIENPLPVAEFSIAGRSALLGQTIHVSDIELDRDFSIQTSIIQASVNLGGWRSIMAVPLLRRNKAVGVLVLARPAARPYTPQQIELVESFADQVVIAMQNAELFGDLQVRTQELSRSLDDLRRAQDRLVQTEKLASLGQLTAGIAHEIKNPLNFVNNFAALSGELIDELREVLQSVPLDAKTHAEVDEVAALLKSNLAKVLQHGKRADSIVRNMLLHSRSGSGERRLIDVNALVEESLHLAYHGARAEKPGFNVTLARDLDPATGTAELYPQEVSRVLLNLIGNGFYATAKRQAECTEPGYEPTLTVATRDRGDHVEIRVWDNGTGIPDEIRAKMFDPFFTTKPAGEGTGLGLSLSHDIVVKQHGGTIDVDTQAGRFSAFTIVLPRDARPDQPEGLA